MRQKNVMFATIVFFFNYIFKFQPNLCNRCHDLLMMSINFSDIAILNIKGSGYRCIISSIRKNEAINLMQSAAFPEKKWNIIKIGKEILTFGNIKIE